MKLLKQIMEYVPINEQEQVDKELIIQFLKRNSDAMRRTNLVAHMTASAIVVNKDMDKVLFAHHNIYDSFGWVGGHNDGDEDCLQVALKEAREETGLTNIKPVTNEMIGIDVIHVDNHIKHGTYVSDHLHLNVTYLLIANEEETPQVNEREHSDIQWFKIDDVLDVIKEERMIPVYTKLFQRVEEYKTKGEQ